MSSPYARVGEGVREKSGDGGVARSGNKRECDGGDERAWVGSLTIKSKRAHNNAQALVPVVERKCNGPKRAGTYSAGEL